MPETEKHSPHDEGIEAHVIINLAPGIGIDEALRLIKGVHLGDKDPGKKFTIIKLHVALGEVDFMADVHCKWTEPMGHETTVIAEWVSAVRQLKIGTQPIVQRTTTAVCINVGG